MLALVYSIAGPRTGSGSAAYPDVDHGLTSPHLGGRLALVGFGRGNRGCAGAHRRAPSTGGPMAAAAVPGLRSALAPCRGSLGEAALWVGAQRRGRLQAVACQGDRARGASLRGARREPGESGRCRTTGCKPIGSSVSRPAAPPLTRGRRPQGPAGSGARERWPRGRLSAGAGTLGRTGAKGRPWADVGRPWPQTGERQGPGGGCGLAAVCQRDGSSPPANLRAASAWAAWGRGRGGGGEFWPRANPLPRGPARSAPPVAGLPVSRGVLLRR